MPPELLPLAQICTKSSGGWGPHWGSLQRSPDPLAGLGGEAPGGKGGTRRGKKGGEGREESPGMPKSRVGKPTLPIR